MKPADRMFVSFKRHLRVETIPAEAVCLISEYGMTALSGPGIERLAPMLDGTRTVAQLKGERSTGLSSAAVATLLARLSDAGLLTYFQSGERQQRDEAASAYWSLAGADERAAFGTLGESPVQIIGLGCTDADAVAGACRASGLTVCAPGADAAFSIVLCDDYLDPALADINADHLTRRRPWLLAKLTGGAAWIGPVFLPGTGACWACLAKRLEGSQVGGYMLRRAAVKVQPAAPRPASLPSTRAAALHLTVLETAKWLAGIRHEGQQCVYLLDTLTLKGGHHPVSRRPQCPSCGDPELMARRACEPVTLAERRTVAQDDGNGQRALPVAEVLRSYQHLIDQVTGIVSEVRRTQGCPEFVHAYVSGRNRAMAETSVYAVRAGLRSHSGGKGTTDAEARAGALCEAVERYCATRDGDEHTIRDSYRGLGAEAVHPDACQLFHERQFAGRARWNATCARFHLVPEPFDERAVMEWTPVWSLLTGEHRLLPTALLYFTPGPPAERACMLRADSNGNAAGSTLEDAVIHGFLELAERDAVALWWYNRTRHPAVDLNSFDDDWVAALGGKYRGLNRDIWVLDVTSDLGIPVMAAISRRTDKPAEDIMLGFGAHFDPSIALRRALTELGQMMPAVAGARADGTGYGLDDPHLMAWWTEVTVDSQRYLGPDPSAAPRAAASYGYVAPGHLDLARMCSTARNARLDILVLDQTRPDIGMPVVKVVMPGLRHFWPRFAPGRLYDVPVRLGRLAEPTAYADLNPIPIYL